MSPSCPARIPQHSRRGWRRACFRSCPYTLRRLRTARFISEVYDSENGTDGTDPFPQRVSHLWRVGLPFYPSGLESEAAPPLRFLQGWEGTRQGLPILGLFACGGVAHCAPSLASGLREINSAGCRFIDGNWTRLAISLVSRVAPEPWFPAPCPRPLPLLQKAQGWGSLSVARVEKEWASRPGALPFAVFETWDSRSQ